MSGGSRDFSWSATEVFLPAGTLGYEGRAYTLFHVPSGCATCRILVTDDFRAHNKILNGDVMMVYDFRVDPPVVHIVAQTSETSKIENNVIALPGSDNYEIVFNGLNDTSMNFTYREFTSEDLARPAFSQSPTFPRNSQTTHFRKLQIRVDSADAEQIALHCDR